MTGVGGGAMVPPVLDPSVVLDASLEQAIWLYGELQAGLEADAWRECERWLGRNDLFYLLVYLCGRKDMLHPWVYARARELQAAPDGYLDLWAREHYKSTLQTFGKTIQDILNDPEITVGIFSHTRPVAKAFLRQIKTEFERNDRLKALYPEILWADPQREAQPWGEDVGIVVKRKANPKEGTVEAWGLVDGQPTGRHYKLRIYDDVVTRESTTTPDQVDKTTKAWELSDNLGSQGGRVRYIGTRYCLPAESRILMADWSHKPIAAIIPGDEVVGWELRDGKRWLVRARVKSCGGLADQPLKRFTFDNGRSVVCTPDHRWWRGAQWAAAAAGAPKWQRGQEYSALGSRYHDLKHIRQLLVPLERSEAREAAWLAGFYDGEGSFRKNPNHPSGVIGFTQTIKNQPLIDYAHAALTKLGFKFVMYRNKNHWGTDNDVCQIKVNGGWFERYRFLTEIAPLRREKIAASLFGQLMTDRLKMISEEDAGHAHVYWIETETGNYVAEGFCSKNSLNDTYAAMMARGVVRVRLKPATDNGRLDGKPVLFTQEEWDQKKRLQSSTVAAQHLQNPMAGTDMMFQGQWLKAWEVRPRTLSIYILCDPSKGINATSDRTAMPVIGYAPGGVKYLVDGYCHRMTLSERWVALMGLHRKWSRMPGVQGVRVGYERYGLQSDTEYFMERMKLDKYAFPITEVSWTREGGQSKVARVERLEPDVRMGQFRLPALVWHEAYPGGLASWRFDEETHQIVYEPFPPETDAVKRLRAAGLVVPAETRAMRLAREAGTPDIVVGPIKAIDEEKRLYDVTRILIDEMLSFSYSGSYGLHDDMVDAASRIYDMAPAAPNPQALVDATPSTYYDS